MHHVTATPAMVDSAGEAVEVIKDNSINDNSRSEAKEVQKLEYKEWIATMEKELRKAWEKEETAAAVHNEVTEKLRQCEADLEMAEEWVRAAEAKNIKLKEELKVMANNLHLLKAAEEKLLPETEKVMLADVATLSTRRKVKLSENVSPHLRL